MMLPTLSYKDACTIQRWALGEHWLESEVGIFNRVERHLRVCHWCQVVEDEFHVLSVCKRCEVDRLLTKLSLCSILIEEGVIQFQFHVQISKGALSSLYIKVRSQALAL